MVQCVEVHQTVPISWIFKNVIDGRENRITPFLRTIKETFFSLFPRPKGFPVAFPSIPVFPSCLVQQPLSHPLGRKKGV